MSADKHIDAVKNALNREIDPDHQATWQRYVVSFNAARGIETASLTETERFSRFLIYMERMITYCIVEYGVKDLASTTEISDTTLLKILGNQGAAFYAHYLGGCLSNETEFDPVSDQQFMEAISVMYAGGFSPKTIIEQITSHPKHCLRVLDYINASFDFNLEAVTLALRLMLLSATKQTDLSFDNLTEEDIRDVQEIEVDAIINAINVLVNTLVVGAMYAED